MPLRTTQAGQGLITQFEQIRLQAYLCPARVPTIGRGVTSEALQAAGFTIAYTDGTTARRVILGKGISAAEERRLFLAVLDFFEDAVERMLKVPVNPAQFDALVSLAWNIGLGALAGSSVIARLNRGDFDGAAVAFLSWNKTTVDGVKRAMPGLVRRRAAEKALFEGDLARASIAGIQARDAGHPMPQKVNPPAPPKTMAQSTTGNTAVGLGLAGLTTSYTAGKAALDVAADVKGTAEQAGALAGFSGSLTLLAGIGLLIVAGAVYVWWDRRRKLHQDLV